MKAFELDWHCDWNIVGRWQHSLWNEAFQHQVSGNQGLTSLHQECYRSLLVEIKRLKG